MPTIAIIRIIAVFIISFLAYKFLDILFDLIKAHIREQNNLKDTNSKNPEPEIIETKFAENKDNDKNRRENENENEDKNGDGGNEDKS